MRKTVTFSRMLYSCSPIRSDRHDALLPPIRDARDSDSEPLAALIAASFAEYPNCFSNGRNSPNCARPASHFAGKGGRLWIANAPGGGIAGSLGVTPVPEQNAVEITKVYADPAFRGSGLAQALFAGGAEDFARPAALTR
jgi:putative acetyltransferase